MGNDLKGPGLKPVLHKTTIVLNDKQYMATFMSNESLK